jgi:hypothetical protein
MGRCRGSAWPGNGGVCRWDPLDPGGSTHLAASHMALVAGKAVAMPLVGGSQECPGALGHGGRPSSCCRLLPPLGQTRGRTVDAASSASSVSTRTWRPAELPPSSRASARLDMGKHGRRRLASSASLASARPWWLVELPRHLQGVPPRARHGDVQQAELSHAVGRAPAVSCLRSAGEQDAWLFAHGWSLGGSARCFFILGGDGCLDPCPKLFHDSVRA